MPAGSYEFLFVSKMADDSDDHHHPPPHMASEIHPQHPPHIYAYPVDPQWMHHHHGMMQMHPMHPMYHPGIHPGDMEGVHLPSGIPGFGASSDPLESVLGPFPCVHLKGLPLEASLEDILLFFQGFVILDVVMASTREAFVVFANPMDFQMALARDRQSMGRQIVEVATGSRATYYAAIAKQHADKVQESDVPPVDVDTTKLAEVMAPSQGAGYPWSLSGAMAGAQMPPTQSLTQRGGMQQHYPGRGGRGMGPPRRSGGGIQVGEHTGFLRMRGLPFSATKEEIVSFFSGYNIVPESIVLTFRNDGRATGEGYIGFATPDDSKAAMSLHRNTMGSRYIELFISNKDEHSRAFARFSGR